MHDAKSIFFDIKIECFFFAYLGNNLMIVSDLVDDTRVVHLNTLSKIFASGKIDAKSFLATCCSKKLDWNLEN